MQIIKLRSCFAAIGVSLLIVAQSSTSEANQIKSLPVSPAQSGDFIHPFKDQTSPPSGAGTGSPGSVWVPNNPQPTSANLFQVRDTAVALGRTYWARIGPGPVSVEFQEFPLAYPNAVAKVFLFTRENFQFQRLESGAYCYFEFVGTQLVSNHSWNPDRVHYVQVSVHVDRPRDKWYAPREQISYSMVIRNATQAASPPPLATVDTPTRSRSRGRVIPE